MKLFPPECSTPGCPNLRATGRQRCGPCHFRAYRARRDLGPPSRVCKIDGCTGRHDAQGLCRRHYNKLVAHPKRAAREVVPPPERPVFGWQWRAPCRGEETEDFFGDEVPEVCGGCPVRELCLADAMVMEWGEPGTMRFGVRGGATPRDRVILEGKMAMSALGGS